MIAFFTMTRVPSSALKIPFIREIHPFNDSFYDLPFFHNQFPFLFSYEFKRAATLQPLKIFLTLSVLFSAGSSAFVVIFFVLEEIIIKIILEVVFEIL